MWSSGGYTKCMDEPEACANCNTRLHPLDVSELYRGEKLDCHVCGYRLKAVATGAWATVATVLAVAAPWVLSRLFRQDGFIGELLIVVLAAGLVWLAPPGLVAGAPWVRIKADSPKLLGVKRRREDMARRERVSGIPAED